RWQSTNARATDARCSANIATAAAPVAACSTRTFILLSRCLSRSDSDSSSSTNKTAPVDSDALESAVCSRVGKSATGGGILDLYGPQPENLNKYLSFHSSDPKHLDTRQS